MSLFDVNKLYFDNSKPYVALSNSPTLYQEIDNYFESNMCDIVFVNIPRSFYGRYINQYLVKLLQSFFPSLVIYNYIYTIQILDSNINKKSYHLGISTNITPNVKQFMLDYLNKNIFHDPETCVSFIINIRLLKPIIPVGLWIDYVHKYNNFLPYNVFFRPYTTAEKVQSYNHAVAFNTETVYYPIQKTNNDRAATTSDQSQKEEFIDNSAAPTSDISQKEEIIDDRDTTTSHTSQKEALIDDRVDYTSDQPQKEELNNVIINNEEASTKLKKKKKRFTKKEKLDRKNKQTNNNPFNLLR